MKYGIIFALLLAALAAAAIGVFAAADPEGRGGNIFLCGLGAALLLIAASALVGIFA